MNREYIAPTVTKDRIGACEEHDVYTHPAFAVIKMSVVQSSRKEKFFGSDVGHMSFINIEILPAEMHRNLSRDWVHPSKGAGLSFNMTHEQFARFITTPNRGEGVSVTLDRVPTGPVQDVPGIAAMTSKQDMLRKEVRQSVKQHLQGLSEQSELLEKLIESGKLSKKELRQISQAIKHHLQLAPGNLDFVIRSAEETLENATETAKIEVNAYVDAVANSLGVRQLRELSAALEKPALPSKTSTEQ